MTFPHAQPDARLLLRSASILPDLLWEIQRALRWLDREVAEGQGLSEGQWHGLVALNRKGPLTVTGLGEALCLEKSTASRVAGSLLADGLVRKRPSRRDGRSVVLQVTEKGRQATRRGLDQRTEVWMDLLAQVGREELSGSQASVSALAQALRAGWPHPQGSKKSTSPSGASG